MVIVGCFCFCRKGKCSFPDVDTCFQAKKIFFRYGFFAGDKIGFVNFLFRGNQLMG